jgi:predicted nucleotidyltransferase
MEPLHPDFKEFLRLLNAQSVEYLLIGGYAVTQYGYPRTTADMDIWIALHPDTAGKMVDVLSSFGLDDQQLTPDLFLQQGDMIRIGVPPIRIEILNEIDGVEFSECYHHRETVEIDGIPVSLISLDDLKRNKKASGRYKDLDDLEHL